MMLMQSLLMLSVSLLLCSGAGLPRDRQCQSNQESGDSNTDNRIKYGRPAEDCQTLLESNGNLSKLPGVGKKPVTPNQTSLASNGNSSELPGVGDRPVKPGEFPWIVALGYEHEHKGVGKWLAEGNLVTDQHVLTAAYCVISISAKLTTIRFGDLELDDTVKDGSQPVDIAVESFISHEQFSTEEYTNDIAIIKMKTKVMFTNFIRPICIPPQGFEAKDYEGYYHKVAGWKLYGNITQTRMLTSEVQILNMDDCRKGYSLKTIVLDSRVLCASSPNHDPCQETAGGPLMSRKQDKSSKYNYFLEGIVSYGVVTSTMNKRNVYTRVSKYRSWITDNIDRPALNLQFILCSQ